MTPATVRLRDEIKKLGYSAIVENYKFSDVFASGADLNRTIPLAAFTHTPASYRSAAIGILQQEGGQAESMVREHTALGAPLFFVLDAETVTVWQAYASGPPRLLERTHVSAASLLFDKKRLVWSPEAIHRAKSLGRVEPVYQLDFVDVGLMPAIEGCIHDKLDRLLTEALSVAETTSSHIHPAAMFHGVFRLLAAKILNDRGHQLASRWDSADVSSILKLIGDYYRLPTNFDYAALGVQLQNPWLILSRGVSAANISADDLAFVYENTLVTPRTRREFGTHSTPRHIAEYIVTRLGLWRDADNPLSVFEPFAGAGVFLVSALRHMREALPIDWSDKQRHDVLVKKLFGAEIDSFACEVATLSLILADYPNRNGWKIETNDLFADNVLKQYLANADVVLCNPPFEAFTAEQRVKYPAMTALSGTRAESVLMATLERHPKALGFVLPRAFLMDRVYREHRRKIKAQYREVELTSLPDGVFKFSQVETALLIARDPIDRTDTQFLRSSEIYDRDRNTFRLTGQPSEVREIQLPAFASCDDRLWIPPLGPLWQRLNKLPRLGHFLEGHWGIRWLDRRQKTAGSDESGPHRALGLLRARDHRQFALGRRRWLDVNPEHLYGGGELPWNSEKILCNAARLSRGSWRIAAAVDRDGLVASQQFVGLWPRVNAPNIDLDACTAILNGPLANAFLNDHSADKRLRISTLLSTPLPPELPPVLPKLVQTYQLELLRRERELELVPDSQLAALLDEIDVLVLEAYDLPPRLVRALLSVFRNQERPVAHSWQPWNVLESDPAFTLAEIKSGRFEFARGDWLKKKLAPVSKSEAERAAEYLP
jgi:N-6 DNA Methylase